MLTRQRQETVYMKTDLSEAGLQSVKQSRVKIDREHTRTHTHSGKEGKAATYVGGDLLALA